MKVLLVFVTSYFLLACSNVFKTNNPAEDIPVVPPTVEVNLLTINSDIIFAPTQSGETSKVSYWMKNNSGKDLTSITVELSQLGSDFSIVKNECSSLAEDKSCEVVLSFTPTSSVKKENTLIIKNQGESVGEVPMLGLNEHFLSNAGSYFSGNSFLNNLSQGSLSYPLDTSSFSIAPSATTLNCGDTITVSTTLANDLHCPGASYAIRIQGNNIVLYGNGKKITGDGSTNAGIYVDGTDNVILGVDVEDITGGFAISGYNTSYLKVLFSTFKNNYVGLRYFNDSNTGSNIVFAGNRVSDSYSGLMTAHSGVTLDQPRIINNVFTTSGMGFVVTSDSFVYDGTEQNSFFDNEIALNIQKSSNLEIKNVDFKNQDLTGVQIYLADIIVGVVENVLLGSNLTPSGQQEQIGVVAYQVRDLTVKDSSFENMDIGLGIQTDSGVSPKALIQNCSFKDSFHSGINIKSNDATALDVITGVNNLFPGAAQNYYLLPGTSISPSSSLH